MNTKTSPRNPRELNVSEAPSSSSLSHLLTPAILCRVDNVHLLIQTLTSVTIGKDSWTTIIFTETAVVLHTPGNDQSSTAGASVPKGLFQEYVIGYRDTNAPNDAQDSRATGNANETSGLLDGASSRILGSETYSGSHPLMPVYSATQEAPKTVQFMVHISSFVDVLSLCCASSSGGQTTNSNIYMPSIPTTLIFPDKDGRLLVEHTTPMVSSPTPTYGQERGALSTIDSKVIRCALITRPIRDRMLDLRFQDALIANRVTIRAELAREIVSDFIALQCEQVKIKFCIGTDNNRNGSNGRIEETDNVDYFDNEFGKGKTKEDSVIFEGLQSPLGDSFTTTLRKGVTEGLLGLVIGDEAVEGRYLLSHFVLALSGSSTPTSSAMRGMKYYAVVGTQEPSTMAFSQITLNVNTERQLCAMHRTRETDVPIRVDIVVSPISSLLEDEFI